jgi:hypothetical protein
MDHTFIHAENLFKPAISLSWGSRKRDKKQSPDPERLLLRPILLMANHLELHT